MKMTPIARASALAALLIAAACGDPDGRTAADPGAAAIPADPDAARIEVRDVGFATPESVVYDANDDVYLVSNINGGPSEKDNNGFISRVNPDGRVAELQWITGGRGDVVLHAPKGVAIKGDTLFVTDIDSLRAFHRTSGVPLGGRALPGAGFLNDVEVAQDGSVYVSDTGIRIGAGGIEQAGTDAIYRVAPGGEVRVLARGADLRNPNGVVADGDGVIVVPFGGNEVYRIGAEGGRETVAQLPGGQLDGVVRRADGTLLVSGWEGQAIYRVTPEGQVTVLLEGIEAPADIGWDSRRDRLLIPQFNANTLISVPVR